jgi:hypothetical protein
VKIGVKKNESLRVKLIMNSITRGTKKNASCIINPGIVNKKPFMDVFGIAADPSLKLYAPINSL